MKFKIITLGCPKNEADMENLKGLMMKKGYVWEDDINNVDLVLIDTCGFIEDAKRESIETILEIAQYKSTNKNLKVIPIGCLVQRYYEDLKKELIEVDGLLGVLPPNMILEKIENKEYYFKPLKPLATYNFECRYSDKVYAYIKIADGCDRNCAFCSIPNFKGKSKSRYIEDIVNEAKFLIDKGIKEIILVSQDNTLYGVDIYRKQALPNLLKRLNDIKGEFWIRVMYLHPDFITDEIIDSIHNLEKVVNYFDIPIQHASDRILKRMGRVKNSSELEKLINKIRKKESTIRTTVMVGFPGETQKDFENLLNFVEKIKFEKLGAFIYSDEEGTKAYNMKDKVEKEIAEKRYEELLELQRDISEELLSRYENKILEVLTEEIENDVYIGRSKMDAPEIDGNVFFKANRKLKVGDFVKVNILRTFEYDMEGEVV